jgi:hypothetical protein
MKSLAFVVGFLAIMAFAVPRIAETDPEPIGAGTSLYLLGFLLVIVSGAAFTSSAARRLVPYALLVASCAGALCSGIFYSAVAFTIPALSLGTVILAGATVSTLFSWVVPRFFRPLPNNSFKPTPLRGAA